MTEFKFEDLSKKTVAQLRKIAEGMEHEALQGAPIIVVSRRAFGFDLRETIINGWEGSVTK